MKRSFFLTVSCMAVCYAAESQTFLARVYDSATTALFPASSSDATNSIRLLNIEDIETKDEAVEWFENSRTLLQNPNMAPEKLTQTLNDARTLKEKLFLILLENVSTLPSSIALLNDVMHHPKTQGEDRLTALEMLEVLNPENPILKIFLALITRASLSRHHQGTVLEILISPNKNALCKFFLNVGLPIQEQFRVFEVLSEYVDRNVLFESYLTLEAKINIAPLDFDMRTNFLLKVGFCLLEMGNVTEGCRILMAVCSNLLEICKKPVSHNVGVLYTDRVVDAVETLYTKNELNEASAIGLVTWATENTMSGMIPAAHFKAAEFFMKTKRPDLVYVSLERFEKNIDDYRPLDGVADFLKITLPNLEARIQVLKKYSSYK